jgi:hypothetical protein
MGVIEIDIDQYLSSMKFASEVIKTNLDYYKKRNQSNFVKIHEDIAIGKMAEFAVFNLLSSKKRSSTEPDLSVYSKKSFDADLMCDGNKIHVKSCRKGSLSWVFEKKDPLVTSPDSNDYIALCQYLGGTSFNVFSIIKANDAEFDCPLKKELTSKVCIYG